MVFQVHRAICRALAVAILMSASVAQAAPVFIDTFNRPQPQAYPVGTHAGYTVSDENTNTFTSTWTADGGTLTYSRLPSGTDPDGYRYNSSVFLTNGADAAAGNTTGLTHFTVSGVIKNVPPVNTAQPGLIVSADTTVGGYILTIDNSLNRDFALLWVDGREILADEGLSSDPPGPHHVIKRLFHPKQGHDYSVAVTVDRSGTHPAFTVLIVDLTAAGSPEAFTYGPETFTDPDRRADAGGRQIGYRVRNPLDAQTPTFGPLSLTIVPEPASAASLVLTTGLLLRRRRQ